MQCAKIKPIHQSASQNAKSSAFEDSEEHGDVEDVPPVGGRYFCQMPLLSHHSQ
jgi:hypothetical protein